MQLSRRRFNTFTLAALAATGLGPAAAVLARRADEPTLFDWKETVGGVKVAFGGGGNAMLLMSRGESLLVDCKNPGLGHTLRREAEAFGSPLKAVVNTHHHRDHVGGNSAFTKSANLIAHENARPRIVGQVEGMLGSVAATLRQLEQAQKPTPPRVIEEVKAFQESIANVRAEDFAPSTLIGKEMEPITVGSVEVRLHRFAPGHTDNDLVVFVPSLNLMHCGDLLFHKNHPFIDIPSGATTKGWQATLAKMIELCDDSTVVVPGHGELTDKTGLQLQIDYFDKMRQVVKHAKDVEGMTKDEVMKLQPGAFQDYGLTQILPRTLGGLYDELAAESPEKPASN